MPFGFRIRQALLADTAYGRSRSDLDAAAPVTLEADDDGAATYEFVLLWTPGDDTTSVESLEQTEEPRVWTFTSGTGQGGTVRIMLMQDQGTPTQKLQILTATFRTPRARLSIPALNEKASPFATLVNGESLVSASERNEALYTLNASFDQGSYAGWHPAIDELFRFVDQAVPMSHFIPLITGNARVEHTVATQLSVVEIRPEDYPAGPLIHTSMQLEAILSATPPKRVSLWLLNLSNGIAADFLTEEPYGSENPATVRSAVSTLPLTSTLYALVVQLESALDPGESVTIHSARIVLTTMSELPLQGVT